MANIFDFKNHPGTLFTIPRLSLDQSTPGMLYRWVVREATGKLELETKSSVKEAKWVSALPTPQWLSEDFEKVFGLVEFWCFAARRTPTSKCLVYAYPTHKEAIQKRDALCAEGGTLRTDIHRFEGELK